MRPAGLSMARQITPTSRCFRLEAAARIKKRDDSYMLFFFGCFFEDFFDIFSPAAGVLVGGVVSIFFTSAGFTGAGLPGPS
jgi:hypothetical protein